MLTMDDHFGIAAKSRKALDRIQNAKNDQLSEDLAWKRPNYSKVIFEEYSDEAFEEKVKRDAAYYNVLFKRLDEDQSANLHKILGNMMGTIRQIYEHIDIKPKVYGLGRLPSLNETDNVIEENATRIISDHINRNYYQLTRDQRRDKYEIGVKSIASDLVVQESIEPEEAVRFGTKVFVVKQFLEDISFPLVVRGEIEDCLTSKAYGEIFEQEKLQDIWESFQTQVFNISKIIASIV